jgi:hypothetical protein
MMEEVRKRTAVGAGTAYGSASDEEEDRVSRAAEAEDDDNLESLRTTGASIPSAHGATVGQLEPPEKAAAESAPTAGPSLSPTVAGGHAAPGREVSVHPEQPREDLKHNEAGIASRLDRVRKQ